MKAIGFDSKCFAFFPYQPIPNIALPRNVAQFANGVADLRKRQEVNRAGFGDDVFLDHQAAHVVGAVEQRKLADLEALRDPARLDVGNVVEIEPRYRLRLQILERTRRRDVGHVGVVGLKRPADERREAVRFVLQLADAFEMLDAFGQRFDVAEHHRRRADAAQFVPDSHHIEPVVGQHFAASHLLANAIDQNLAAAARQTAQAGGFESRQHFAKRQLADLREVMNLRRAEAVDIDLREL